MVLHSRREVKAALRRPLHTCGSMGSSALRQLRGYRLCSDGDSKEAPVGGSSFAEATAATPALQALGSPELGGPASCNPVFSSPGYGNPACGRPACAVWPSGLRTDSADRRSADRDKVEVDRLPGGCNEACALVTPGSKPTTFSEAAREDGTPAPYRSNLGSLSFPLLERKCIPTAGKPPGKQCSPGIGA
eukprot:scaffold301_cov243-Pinguiococcus_pyrenoidosus.AAC.156